MAGHKDRVDAAGVLEQYKTSSNLHARMALHQHFKTGKENFARTVFDKYAFGDNAQILEIGCGTAGQWVANRDRIKSDWQIVLSDLSEGMIREARQSFCDAGQHMLAAVIDAQAIPFGDASFDAVIANHML